LALVVVKYAWMDTNPHGFRSWPPQDVTPSEDPTHQAAVYAPFIAPLALPLLIAIRQAVADIGGSSDKKITAS
jgi:hypothetical protein